MLVRSACHLRSHRQSPRSSESQKHTHLCADAICGENKIGEEEARQAASLPQFDFCTYDAHRVAFHRQISGPDGHLHPLLSRQDREAREQDGPLSSRHSSEDVMQHIVRATITSNPHVKTLPVSRCHFKSNDQVRVKEGEFKGFVGRVIRVAGQQRVALEIKGLCYLATAFVPSAFLEKVGESSGTDCSKSGG